jgi:hypothetical protein
MGLKECLAWCACLLFLVALSSIQLGGRWRASRWRGASWPGVRHQRGIGGCRRSRCQNYRSEGDRILVDPGQDHPEQTWNLRV